MIKRIAWNKGKPWTKKAKERLSKSLLKRYADPTLHPRWKGGERITNQGYTEIKSLTHPCKNKQGYVPKHRLVVEKYLGRFLTKDEIIHHINENPKDNCISNLYLFEKRWQHCVYHRFVKRGKVKKISHSNIITLLS